MPMSLEIVLQMSTLRLGHVRQGLAKIRLQLTF